VETGLGTPGWVLWVWRPLFSSWVHAPLVLALHLTPSNSVVSGAVPLGNVSWMFQEGRSLKLRLRRGVGQAAHARNNPHVKCTGVYCV
jgi:hypothetical protein